MCCFSHRMSLVPLSLTTGISLSFSARVRSLLISSVSCAMKSFRKWLKNSVRAKRAVCTLLSGTSIPFSDIVVEPMPPWPAVFKHPFQHPASSANGHRFTPDSLYGERYMIPVRYPYFILLFVFWLVFTPSSFVLILTGIDIIIIPKNRAPLRGRSRGRTKPWLCIIIVVVGQGSSYSTCLRLAPLYRVSHSHLHR